MVKHLANSIYQIKCFQIISNAGYAMETGQFINHLFIVIAPSFPTNYPQAFHAQNAEENVEFMPITSAKTRYVQHSKLNLSPNVIKHHKPAK
jgi:hypothetical protein